MHVSHIIQPFDAETNSLNYEMQAHSVKMGIHHGLHKRIIPCLNGTNSLTTQEKRQKMTNFIQEKGCSLLGASPRP